MVNIEDPYGKELLKQCKKHEELITYGIEQGDFHAREVRIEHNGVQFTLVTPTGEASYLYSTAGAGEFIQLDRGIGGWVCARRRFRGHVRSCSTDRADRRPF